MSASKSQYGGQFTFINWFDTIFLCFFNLKDVKYPSFLYESGSCIDSLYGLQVFEYGTVIRDVVDIHCPVNEMVCNSKIR